MVTPNSAPVEPNPTVPLADIGSAMRTPMPAPTEIERQGAISAAVADVAPPAPPLETPVVQPHIEQPTPIQPVVPQPVPTQPVPGQPQVPVQPSPPDPQQQINDLTARVQAFEGRETVYEAQRTELETQASAAQLQRVQTGAMQAAQQHYNEDINLGVPAEDARKRAMTYGQTLYDAYGASLQSQQATTQTQAIAKQYGINPQDIPVGLPQQAMEQFASMKADLNRLNGQTQTISQNQAPHALSTERH